MSKKSNDAERAASLAGILQMSNKPKEVTPPPSPALPPTSPAAEVPAPIQRVGAKKVGKYRDPSYHHYGFYLRKDTHKQVKRRLEDDEPGKDISELMQELLEQWLKDR